MLDAAWLLLAFLALHPQELRMALAAVGALLRGRPC